MTEGRIQPDGKSVIFPHPEMEGIEVEVQHSVNSGKPFSEERGMVGCGVVTLPTGQPRIVLQLRHADGTSVSATLNNSDLIALIECLMDAGIQAERVAQAAAVTVRQ